MKLIILDIDETLLHASDVPVENSTSIGPFHVVLRPHLKEFLNFLF
ncbi:NIF family HAD-type phosphatase [Halobacteriovorax sp. GB3]|nr:NIF family HAD-type phosphatase [Halobacteriovorax sp. GB3]MDD0852764.1 NIF family HAD-type phosphatase [Halobacteriovorax sp. GB3]